MDDSGGLLVTYRYDAFGGIRSQSFAHENYWLFAGEQRDSETGYDYLRARYYDSETGRFVSVDPLGGGYPYALGNPLMFTDPLGLYAICGWHDIWGDICFDSTEVGYSPCDIYGACYLYTPDGPFWALACDSSGNCLFPDGTILGAAYYVDHILNYLNLVMPPGGPSGGGVATGYAQLQGTACFIICVSIALQLGSGGPDVQGGLGVGSPGGSISIAAFPLQTTGGTSCVITGNVGSFFGATGSAGYGTQGPVVGGGGYVGVPGFSGICSTSLLDLIGYFLPW